MVLALQHRPSYVLQPFSTPGGTFSIILPWGVRLGLFDATISILAFLFKPALGLFFGSIHDHPGGNPITLEDKGERFVSIALLLHWVHTRPMEASGVHLGVQLTAPRLSLGHHRISKTIVTKALVSKLPVVCPETSG
jgi:hypothetical protein